MGGFQSGTGRLASGMWGARSSLKRGRVEPETEIGHKELKETQRGTTGVPKAESHEAISKLRSSRREESLSSEKTLLDRAKERDIATHAEAQGEEKSGYWRPMSYATVPWQALFPLKFEPPHVGCYGFERGSHENGFGPGGLKPLVFVIFELFAAIQLRRAGVRR
ncbi:MAG: hypothetical protein HZA90_12045 [Verrucomicrobia bacterium]|nr:hypothetical protein [Verrucomicrobiota bacterium]